ncbi:TM2 domain-containing protein [Lysinibacillus sp. NPDC092081]|uniref:TM2 domain-containing protein n=1 Tax=Lysinibacillus sp. NPDC092081 TaxID=3364131 RepID=UPI00382AA13C
MDYISDRSYKVTMLLCFFLGYFGAHRFYAEKIETGLLIIVTLGGLCIWVLIDLFMIVIGNFPDKEGYKIYLIAMNNALVNYG